ncbi:hypothetical protein OIDMADRAFT_35614 [Oidiodendron maius Zn]|uniref:Uncharacterized protein n=1 Tax=Oidiodendron maius (strain Zn) TaxID=913774 RepID=A0A0C3C3N8_OIDMZ|nr:hypothetical protein OIDMADRAFT_35614 [Oidiodendron maius Zn]
MDSENHGSDLSLQNRDNSSSFAEKYQQVMQTVKYYKQYFRSERKILELTEMTIDIKLKRLDQEQQRLQLDRDQFRQDQKEFEEELEKLTLSIRQIQQKLQADRDFLLQYEDGLDLMGHIATPTTHLEPSSVPPVASSAPRLVLGNSERGEAVFGGVDKRGNVYRRIQKPISRKSAISHDEVAYEPCFASMTKEEIDLVIRSHVQMI